MEYERRVVYIFVEFFANCEIIDETDLLADID